MSGEPMVALNPGANFDDQVNAIYAAIGGAKARGAVTLLTVDGEPAAAIVPADRCSACNRVSRTMRNRGDGVLWCGRTACLEAVRELRRGAGE